MNRVDLIFWRCALRVGGLTCCLLMSAGCQQDMAKQPSYRPLDRTDFFEDERSSRPRVPGTVARGQFRGDDPLLFTGKVGGGMQPAALVGFGAGSPLAVAVELMDRPRSSALAEYTDVFPFPVTAEVLERGRQRYGIFCAVCHDPSGNGNGIIVQRGYTKPPSYIKDTSRGLGLRGVNVLLRDVPVSYYYEVISKGFGAMADYSAQVPPRDRWAIVAYIRALQFSQYAPLDKLPERERQDALKALEAKP